MSKTRSIIVGALTAVAGLALVATPAGASSSPHPKFVAYFRHIAPKLTRGHSNKQLAEFATATCSDLNSGNSIADEAEQLLSLTHSQWPFTPYQDGELIAASVVLVCPSFLPELQQFINQNNANGTTVSYTVPDSSGVPFVPEFLLSGTPLLSTGVVA